jgi:hypothetical protein
MPERRSRFGRISPRSRSCRDDGPHARFGDWVVSGPARRRPTHLDVSLAVEERRMSFFLRILLRFAVVLVEAMLGACW